MDLYTTILFTSSWFGMWLTVALVTSPPQLGIGLATVGLFLAMGLGTPLTLFDRRRGAAVSLLGLGPLAVVLTATLLQSLARTELVTALVYVLQLGLLLPSLIACTVAIGGPETQSLPYKDGVLAVLASIPPMLVTAWVAVLLLLWEIIPSP